MGNNEAKTLAEFTNCLSILESQTSVLYKNLSIRVNIPLIKTLLNGISIDSQKHSELLKGVTESIAPTKGNQKKMRKIQRNIAKSNQTPKRNSKNAKSKFR